MMMFKASEELEKEIIERLKIEYKRIVDGDEKLGMWEQGLKEAIIEKSRDVEMEIVDNTVIPIEEE
jgi:hypothetical protein